MCLKNSKPQNILLAKMNLCTCSKRIAAIFSFSQQILSLHRLQNLLKPKHLFFTTESEGEWTFDFLRKNVTNVKAHVQDMQSLLFLLIQAVLVAIISA